VSAQDYDVIIAGAGMVGACAALALARKGMRIALIEATRPVVGKGRKNKSYDLRVSAISPRSRRILQQLGVWQALEAKRVCYYEQMLIWHQHGNASVAFDAVDLARNNLGAIVENSQIQAALYHACQQQAEIKWFMPDHIDALLHNSPQAVAVQLGSGVRIDAGLLIAADGRNSPTRLLAGIDVQYGDYRQTAFVANVTTEAEHQHTAWQRFLTTGPLAFLPLANGQSSIVWSCDTELAQRLEKFSDSDFCEALGEAFEFKLGQVISTSKRMSFVLGWHSCERWLDHSVVLIGDAAHGVHPLAGQGVNLGFSDVELLASLITKDSNSSRHKQLRRYERQRKSETWMATKSFSGLKWLYGMDNRALVGIRDLGMRLVESNPIIKRELMQRATENLT